MPAPPPGAKLPKPALLALAGVLAGLLAALTAGELVWYVLAPGSPPPAPDAQPDAPKPEPKPQAAPPRLAVAAAPVTVYAGGKNRFAVRVARDKFDTPVTVRFESPDGLNVAEVAVPAGSATAQAEVVAPPDLRPGTYTLTAAAVATADEHTLRARTPFQVTVPPPPAPPARLGVSASPKAAVYQRGKNTFAVRVARAEFDDPVTVAFDNLPAGVKIPAVTVPAGKTEAVAEVSAEGAAKIGVSKINVTATAVPKGGAVSAAAEVAAVVLDPSRVPLDVVLVLDCTGSMRDTVSGLVQHLPAFAEALAKARFDARFGVVGFRDTTMKQPLELPQFDGEPLTPDAARVARSVRGVRLWGGGLDGESSLDGIAKAADYPLRVGGPRVLVLVTDGAPKRSDGRVGSIDDAARHLQARRVDQLHVVTTAEHRKRYEPLWAGAKGEYFELGDKNKKVDMDALMAGLAKAIVGASPPQPEPSAEPSPGAPTPTLPPPGPVKAPAPPASPEPGEPPFAPPEALAPEGAPAAPPKTEPPPPARPLAALSAWAASVACVAALVLFFAQMLLPGERPTSAALASGYGGGVPVGLVAGGLAFVALDGVAQGLPARLGAAGLFGLMLGLSAAVAEVLLRAPIPPTAQPLAASRVSAPTPAKPPAATTPQPQPTAPKSEPLPDLDLPVVEAYSPPTAKPPVAPPKPAPPPLLDLDLPPVEAYPSAATKASPPPAPAAHKPNIGGPAKPGDGCPGCGRKIPGDPGTRYCMLCDKTF